MSQQSNTALSAARRIVMVALCLLLVFTVFSKPVVVHASTFKDITLKGESTSIGTEFIAIALVAIVAGYSFSELSDAVNEYRIIYNSDSTIKNWADNAAVVYGSGSTVIPIPSAVITAFNTQFEKDRRVLPASLQAVRTLSDSRLAQLESVSVSEVAVLAQTAGVSIDDYLYKQIVALRDEFGFIYRTMYNLTQAFRQEVATTTGHLNTVLQALRQEVATTTGHLNTVLQAIRQEVATSVDHVNTVLQAMRQEVATSIGRVNTVLQALRQDIATTQASLNTSIQALRQDLVDSISDLRTDINTKIDELIDVISTGDYVKVIQDSVSTNVATQAVQGIIAGVDALADFFNPSGGNDDKIPYWDFLLGQKLGSSIWSFFVDSEFMAALTSFFNFVAALWLMFPLGIRYFILFGFCFPFMFSVLKMFVG